MNEVTEILSQLQKGDTKVADELLPLVYDELRRLAAGLMAREKPGQTLQPTALVHEAYIRLVVAEHTQHFDNRVHFLAAAAEAMRRILVEKARHKQRAKHGGSMHRVNLEQACATSEDRIGEVLMVDEALRALAIEDPQKAELVKLRYFGGMSLEESAAALGISVTTAGRYWTYSKAFLYCFLEDERRSMASKG